MGSKTPSLYRLHCHSSVCACRNSTPFPSPTSSSGAQPTTPLLPKTTPSKRVRFSEPIQYHQRQTPDYGSTQGRGRQSKANTRRDSALNNDEEEDDEEEDDEEEDDEEEDDESSESDSSSEWESDSSSDSDSSPSPSSSSPEQEHSPSNSSGIEYDIPACYSPSSDSSFDSSITLTEPITDPLNYLHVPGTYSNSTPQSPSDRRRAAEISQAYLDFDMDVALNVDMDVDVEFYMDLEAQDSERMTLERRFLLGILGSMVVMLVLGMGLVLATGVKELRR
jgi:cobalamin biosynthesis protein CobT